MKLYINCERRDSDNFECYLITEQGEILDYCICISPNFAEDNLTKLHGKAQKLQERFGNYEVIHLGDDSMTRERLLWLNHKFYEHNEDNEGDKNNENSKQRLSDISGNESLEDCVKTIARHYGIVNQIDKTIEECIELSMECLKLQKGKCNKHDLIGEIADVLIMCGQMIELMDINKTALHKTIEYKINRQIQRMNRENS